MDEYPDVPTTGWVPGEYLVDSVVIEMPEALVASDPTLMIGWYDESTGLRLVAQSAAGEDLGTALSLQISPSGE